MFKNNRNKKGSSGGDKWQKITSKSRKSWGGEAARVSDPAMAITE